MLKIFSISGFMMLWRLLWLSEFYLNAQREALHRTLSNVIEGKRDQPCYLWELK